MNTVYTYSDMQNGNCENDHKLFSPFVWDKSIEKKPIKWLLGIWLSVGVEFRRGSIYKNK